MLVIKKPAYVMTAEEVLAFGETKPPMLWYPYLQKIGLALLCGSSDGGKSFFCLYIAMAICRGDKEVFGILLEAIFRSVIFVCTEDEAEIICGRLTALLGETKLIEGKLRFIFESDNLVQKLEEEIEREPADMVVIDTFGDLFSGAVNDSISIRQHFKPYKRLAKKKKCLFLFCHHIGKGKENNTAPNKNDVLGSQGIESACRTVIILKKRPDAKRVLTIVKGNNIPEELKDKGLVLEFSPEFGFKPTEESVKGVEAGEKGISEKEMVEKEVVDLYIKMRSYRKVAAKLNDSGKKFTNEGVGQIIKKHRLSVPNTKESAKTDSLE